VSDLTVKCTTYEAFTDDERQYKLAKDENMHKEICIKRYSNNPHVMCLSAMLNENNIAKSWPDQTTL